LKFKCKVYDRRTKFYTTATTLVERHLFEELANTGETLAKFKKRIRKLPAQKILGVVRQVETSESWYYKEVSRLGHFTMT
jgi:hypothetical protein